jgi:hypothetical protein
MFCTRSGIAAAVLAGVMTTGLRSAVAQSPGAARTNTPAVQTRGRLRLSAEATVIHNQVKKRPGELKWQNIPWQVDLPEAFRQAKAENRPVLLWATDDDPLDRC